MLLIAALFLVVCVGWFTWFNRLARRHRRVQKELTERQVVDAGERRLTALVHNSADVVMTLDGDSTATFVSPAAQAVLGIDPPDLIGQPGRGPGRRGGPGRLRPAAHRDPRRRAGLSMRMLHADGASWSSRAP